MGPLEKTAGGVARQRGWTEDGRTTLGACHLNNSFGGCSKSITEPDCAARDAPVLLQQPEMQRFSRCSLISLPLYRHTSPAHIWMYQAALSRHRTKASVQKSGDLT